MSRRRRPLLYNPGIPGDPGHPGFTLLELMVVLTLILIMASFGLAIYHTVVVRVREATLREELFTMRAQIDRFTHDNERGPASLEELVEKGYMGSVPVDPFTSSDQTWQLDTETTSISIDPSAPLGIVDVHSGSNDNSLDGTPYSAW
jgi:general secretion pathway protein G